MVPQAWNALIGPQAALAGRRPVQGGSSRSGSSGEAMIVLMVSGYGGGRQCHLLPS